MLQFVSFTYSFSVQLSGF